MSLISPTNYVPVLPERTDGQQEILNRIKESKSGKDELKKVAKEFEGIFIAKMFSLMDKTVDREGGIFGKENSYYEKFKSYMYNELGRDLASKPNSTFGFAKQIYEQMEKYVKE